MADVDYSQALDGIAGKLDVLHADNADLLDALGDLQQDGSGSIDLSALDDVAQLLAYTDLLLVVVCFALFLIAGLFVGFIVVDRLR